MAEEKNQEQNLSQLLQIRRDKLKELQCTIRLEGTDKTYSGKMVNISANGFAFSVRDNVFASQKGRNVQLDVKDFAVIGNKPLTGCVIRSSNNEGEFIVGCRMPEDSEPIKEYVSRNYNGN